ncbi:hypothetical protein [Chamaesiphon sp. VAR_48_metabat_403]|nr:hypothetical protein [Chamaesiphon sp. VAR_48_metabat_403]
MVWSLEDDRVSSFLRSVVTNNQQYLDPASLSKIEDLLKVES